MADDAVKLEVCLRVWIAIFILLHGDLWNYEFHEWQAVYINIIEFPIGGIILIGQNYCNYYYLDYS